MSYYLSSDVVATVVRFEFDAKEGEDHAGEATITVARVPMSIGSLPRIDDVPDDIARALRVWLAGNGNRA